MRPVPADVPVEPAPPEALDWFVEELAKPEYQAAQPTFLDLVAKGIADWFASLQFAALDTPPAIVLLVIGGILAIGLVLLVIVFGRPRLNRRSAGVGALFGDDDGRTADDLRRDADAAARSGDWASAIADRFRAVARSVADREIVAVLPGTTAHEFARGAAVPFPAEREAPRSAAAAFDAVRYLSRPGDEPAYRALAELDGRLAAARPVEAAVAPTGAVEPPR